MMKIKATTNTRKDYSVDLGEYQITAWKWDKDKAGEISIGNGRKSKRNHGCVSIDSVEDVKKIIDGLFKLIVEIEST